MGGIFFLPNALSPQEDSTVATVVHLLTYLITCHARALVTNSAHSLVIGVYPTSNCTV